MGQLEKPLPVQVFAGLIANPAEGLDRARGALVEAWGPIDTESPVWPFDFTDYYGSEMGEGLLRQFVTFGELEPLEGLRRLKVESNEIERRLAGDSTAGVARPVNIDPGYICPGKLVLFSGKDYSHRIYIGDGVYAEVTLEWHKDGFSPLGHTFPDFRTAHYGEFFAGARRLYVEKLRAWKEANRP